MKAIDFNLKTALVFEPEHGRLLLRQNRMLLFRQEALGTLRSLLGEQLGDKLSRALLTQFGQRCGAEDHRTLSQLQWDSEADELACGPVIHSWEGLVRAEPTLLDFNRTTGHFHMKGTWTNSYEAEAYLAERGQSREPVCHTLVGYASGWCSAFMRRPMVAIETHCAACGAPRCEFEVKPAEAWGPEADAFKAALAATQNSLTRELEEKLAMIEAQRAAIAELSTPIIQVWDEILCLPVVGTVDTARSAQMTDRVLDAVVRHRSRAVIIDITGIEVMDTKTADHFIKMAKAIKLLGCEPIVTGVSPAIAQTLTHIGIELGEIRTLRSLRDALAELLRSKVVAAPSRPGAKR